MVFLLFALADYRRTQMVHFGFVRSFVEFIVLRDGICQAELPNHWVDVVARGFIRLEPSELGTCFHSLDWWGVGRTYSNFLRNSNRIALRGSGKFLPSPDHYLAGVAAGSIAVFATNQTGQSEEISSSNIEADRIYFQRSSIQKRDSKSFLELHILPAPVFTRQLALLFGDFKSAVFGFARNIDFLVQPKILSGG